MDLTTLDGTTYRDVKVTRVEADGLAITHASGAGKIEFLNLPEEVRKKYAYDPAKSEAAQKAAASGWQEMDQRLVFLTVQLSSVEASLTALNRALVSLGIQRAFRQNDAESARHLNESMDRNAGGPVPWADFYGRTAEKFFYHPTDRNTSYHTLTVLKQMPASDDVAPKEGVPSRQGLPVSQRPPQFDYIYRANRDAEKRAQEEVARLGNNTEAIFARRRQLEAEQSALWSKIAFHAVAGRELLTKPLYFYDLKSAEADTVENRQRLEALRAAMDYLRNGNKLAAMVEEGVEADAVRCYSQLQKGVDSARGEMQRRLMAQPLVAGDISDSRTMLGKFVAVAKRMSEVSANINDAYRLALDGDRAADQGRKLTFRSQLQQSLMLCAEALLAGDECVTDLAREWKVQPAVQTTAAPASASVQSLLAVPPPQPVVPPTAPVASAVKTAGAAITISCSERVSILPLEAGQTALSDPKKKKQLIKNISPELSGWQFVSIPWHTINSYEIRVNQDGVLYAFGGGSKQKTSKAFLGTKEVSNWDDSEGAISGNTIHNCLRRKVTAGETIKLNGLELQLAAKSIQLTEPAGDIKTNPDTQTAVPVPTPAVVAPPLQVPPEVQELFTPAFAALPMEKRRNRVTAKLKQLNPSLVGDIKYKKENSEVTEIEFTGTGVVNIWPLRALANLEVVRFGCPGDDRSLVSDLSPLRGLQLVVLDCSRSRVGDLSPLAGMPLTEVHCQFSPVSDLSPLRGMKLTVLNCSGTKVQDLSVLSGMPLQVLWCYDSPVSDLSPLRGMKLTELNFAGTRVQELFPLAGMPLQKIWCERTTVSDLSPLRGMPLTTLGCYRTQVSDLSPLRGMKLTAFSCGGTQVKDLSPLAGMPLQGIWCADTQVSDLSPLRDMPLTELNCDKTAITDLAPLKEAKTLRVLNCDFKPERDSAILRPIKTLERINERLAAEFWKGVDAGRSLQAGKDDGK